MAGGLGCCVFWGVGGCHQIAAVDRSLSAATEEFLSSLSNRHPAAVTRTPDGRVCGLFIFSELATQPSLRALRTLPDLTSLTFRLRPENDPLNPVALHELASLTNLQSLRIECARSLAPGVFVEICRLSRLRTLEIARPVPPASEYPCITNLTELRELAMLEAPNFGDKELNLLVALPKLRTLRLFDTAVSSNWLAIVRSFPALVEAKVVTADRREIVTWTRNRSSRTP